MTSTSYRFADYAKAHRTARSACPRRDRIRANGKWTANYTRQPDAQAPAGGVSTTLNDLVRWMRLLLGDGKFDGRQGDRRRGTGRNPHAANRNELFARRRPRRLVTAWGGTSASNAAAACSGNTPASSLWACAPKSRVLPSEELAIAVLSNAAPTGIPEGLDRKLLSTGARRQTATRLGRIRQSHVRRRSAKKSSAKLGDYSHAPTAPVPPMKLSAYVGKYANEFFGPIEFDQKNLSSL